MWIDTHCHLDAAECAEASEAAADAALRQGVSMIVIPAIERGNFERVAQLAHARVNCSYALGIHPVFVPGASENDLHALRAAVSEAMQDERFVAIGEIGLDFFVPMLTTPAMRRKQEFFYSEQLKLARDFGLPVLLHVRRSQDQILKYLRRIAVPGGIGHAFNGSFQQAETFIGMGFKLGFGGAMTFTRALQIRRLATELPLGALVLETDAPDISPAWLRRERNTPDQLPRIGAVLAGLRGMSAAEVARATCANAIAAMPRLNAVLSPNA
jgi:TatD DNase family protein